MHLNFNIVYFLNIRIQVLFCILIIILVHVLVSNLSPRRIRHLDICIYEILMNMYTHMVKSNI